MFGAGGGTRRLHATWWGARNALETTQMSGEWHTEANVQSCLVTALVTDGWRILSVANTATKEHGIDVIASRDGQTVGIEVKGFPSRNYANPARADEIQAHEPKHAGRTLALPS